MRGCPSPGSRPGTVPAVRSGRRGCELLRALEGLGGQVLELVDLPLRRRWYSGRVGEVVRNG